MLKTVSSMGGGGGSSNVFATDITVNGLTVGRGDGNVSTNTAFGVDALGSPVMSASNNNNVAIGYNSLNNLTTGVATITVTNGGSGYNDDGNENFNYFATCTFVSGAPATTYPQVTLTVVGGIITSAVVANSGSGFTVGSPTVMTVPDYSGYGGSGVVLNVGTYAVASNNTAVGYNAGNTNATGVNSIYIGSGATGTGTNEIVIGANASGLGSNTIVIGNANTTSTTLQGGFSLVGSATANQTIASAQTTGTLIIGGSGSATGTITLGRATGSQTVGIATGINVISAKTVNIGTGATNGATTINIGPTGTVNGSTTVNIATQVRTSNNTEVNIGTNATGGNSNISLGSLGAGTIINSNGIVQQRIYTGINSFTAIAGRKAFVSDHRSDTAYPTFGEAYASTGRAFGPFNVPVFADGTIWRVG